MNYPYGWHYILCKISSVHFDMYSHFGEKFYVLSAILLQEFIAQENNNLLSFVVSVQSQVWHQQDPILVYLKKIKSHLRKATTKMKKNLIKHHQN